MASGSIHNCGENCGNNCEEMLRPLEFHPMSRMSDVLLFLGAMLAVITDALKDVDIVFPLILTCYNNVKSCVLIIHDMLCESKTKLNLVLSNNITSDNATELTTVLTHSIEKLNAIIVRLESCYDAVLYLHTAKQKLIPLPSNDDTIEKCINCKCNAATCKNIIGIATLNCGHHLCAECLNSILDSKNCPECDCDIENFQELIASILEPIDWPFNDDD